MRIKSDHVFLFYVRFYVGTWKGLKLGIIQIEFLGSSFGSSSVINHRNIFK